MLLLLHEVSLTDLKRGLKRPDEMDIMKDQAGILKIRTLVRIETGLDNFMITMFILILTAKAEEDQNLFERETVA